MALLTVTLLAAAIATPPVPPVFETGVDVVAIDASVVDGRGAPVRGLTADDFTATVDGRPRRVVAAEFVDYPAAGRAEPEPPVASDFSTNEGVRPGRLVLLVVDQGNISVSRGRAAIRAADRLVDQLTESDRIGLVTLPPPGPGVDPTGDHAAVRRALAKVVGRGPSFGGRLGPSEALAYQEGDSRWQEVESRECPESAGQETAAAASGSTRDREFCLETLQGEAALLVGQLQQQSRASIHALEALFGALAAIDGPKSVLLLTEGLWAEDATQVRSLADLAGAARVALYVLQLETPLMPDATSGRATGSAIEDRELRGNALASLAALSRGEVFRVGGSGEGVYDRIARELSGHYVLRLEPEPTDRDDRDHAIRVTIARKGAQVRARSRLRIPPPGKARKDEEKLAAALLAPFVLTELPVRVASYSLRGDTGKLKVFLAAEVGGVEGDHVSYAFRLLDAEGRVAASGGQRLQGLGGEPTIAVTATAVVAPGTYALRFAFLDAAGRRGSVDRTVTAALSSSGGLEVGDLLLGPSPAPGQAFRPGLDVRHAGDVVALVEAYPREAGQLDAVSVSFEVAESADGPALLSLPARLGRPSDAIARSAQTRIPTAVLPPGDYVARAAVSLGERPLLTVRRPFHVLPHPALATAETVLSRELLLPALRRFDREALLRAEVVGHFVDRVSELAPGPSSPRLDQAMALARRGETARLVEALASADDRDARVAFLRGIGYLAQGAVPQASAAFHVAVDRASNLLPAMVYLGACHAAAGRDREAVGAWQTALISESASPALAAVLADALLRLDEAARSVAVAKEALVSWPDDEAMKRRLALGLARTGRSREALDLLTTHVERHPDDAGALFVTLHLLLQSLTTAGTSATPELAERVRRYARAYLASAGMNPQSREMIAHWLRYLEKAGR